jgi:hypothetical protein
MVRTTLVESEIENGKRIINRLDEAHLNFPVIFWMYDEDADNWKLVFSREDINKLGKRYFYQKLDEGITLTLIDTNNALIKALRAFISMPTIGGSWFTGNSINGRMFPDAYLYRVA